MKTRDRILATALDQFNAHGISAVSSRNISDELGISYGNLCYHFPKKDDLILQLYLNLQTEMDEQFSNIQKEILGFDFMIRSLRTLLEVLYKYRFIYLDNTLIVRKFKKLRKHAVGQFDRRKALLQAVADFLVKGGFLREERVEGHYDRLLHGLLIVLNSWITDAEIFYKGKEEDKVDYYLELLYAVIRPSLTKQGLQAFEEVYKKEIIGE